MVSLELQEKLSLPSGMCSQGWEILIRRSGDEPCNYFWLWHAVSYRHGIKFHYSALEGLHWQPSGLSRAVNAPHTSRSILLLAMAACSMIWPSLVQPHCSSGALSNTRPRHQVPKADVVWPRSGSMGFSQGGSWPFVVSPQWLPHGTWLHVSHPMAEKAGTLYKKAPDPKDRPLSEGPAHLLNMGWDWQQAQLGVHSIPGKHQCHGSPRAAEKSGEHGALPSLPQGEEAAPL